MKNYRKEYLEQMLENSKQSKFMLRQSRIIDEMAKTINMLDIDDIICKNVKECNMSGNPSNNVCVDCIRDYVSNQVDKKYEKEEKNVGRIIIFNDSEHPIKVWLNGDFFGSSDEIEILIWDSYALSEKYDDLDFTYIDKDDFEDYEDYAFDYLKNAISLDPTEEKIIFKKRWDLLYKYHDVGENSV